MKKVKNAEKHAREKQIFPVKILKNGKNMAFKPVIFFTPKKKHWLSDATSLDYLLGLSELTLQADCAVWLTFKARFSLGIGKKLLPPSNHQTIIAQIGVFLSGPHFQLRDPVSKLRESR